MHSGLIDDAGKEDINVLSGSFNCSVLGNPANDSLPLYIKDVLQDKVPVYPGNTHLKTTET